MAVLFHQGALPLICVSQKETIRIITRMMPHVMPQSSTNPCLSSAARRQRGAGLFFGRDNFKGIL